MSKPKVQRIRIKNRNIFGWLDGKNTTLYWDSEGTLYGPTLYRLAKAIVRRFEEAVEEKSKKKGKKDSYQYEMDFGIF